MFDYHNKEIDALCTPHQLKILNAYRELGIQEKAAEMLGTTHSNIKSALRKIRKKANARLSELHDATKDPVIPEGYHVKGASSAVRNADGLITWIKTDIDKVKQVEAFNHYISALGESLPRVESIAPPQTNAPDLLCQYTITDYHLGMMAWHEETGADWDMKIAEELLMKWFSAAARMAPDSDTAILANIGDFMHWDGMEAVTPAHRNILDADTRFSKLCRIASRCIVQAIRILLVKHKRVHVIMCDANHDPASEAWIRAWLPIVFENEPRVTIDQSPSPYNAYQFGKVALFYHHGHRRRQKAIDSVFVRQFREIYGTSEHCYAHMGHLHNDTVVESNLMITEQHRTLAAPDAYAAGGGWLSGRSAKVITYHRTFGEVARNTITPEMLGY